MPARPVGPVQLLHRRCSPVQHVHLRPQCLLLSGLLFLNGNFVHRVLPAHHPHPGLRTDYGCLKIGEDAFQPPHRVHTEECHLAGIGGLLLHPPTLAFLHHRRNTSLEGTLRDCRNRGEGE